MKNTSPANPLAVALRDAGATQTPEVRALLFAAAQALELERDNFAQAVAALEEERKRFDLLRRAALSLAGDACGLAAEVESMSEAGLFDDCDADGDAESAERRSALLALCDSIALEAGKVDTYAERGDA